MTTTPVMSSINLATVTDSGKAPKSRITDPTQAAQICQLLTYGNQERSRFNARVKGMFEGMPPFNTTRLKQEAMLWKTNVNFLEAKSSRSAALVPFYDLFSGATFYAQIRTAVGNPTDRQTWSDIQTEEFDRLLKSYDGFDFNMQQMLCDMVGFGKGFQVFSDRSDWRFRCASQDTVFVPDGTNAYTGNLEVLVIRHRFRVHELYQYIDNRKTASETGWNVDAVTRAIVHAMPETPGDASVDYNYEWLQQRIKDRELYDGIRCPIVRVFHMLVREFSGKISHFILREFSSTGRPNGVRDEFLFKSVDRFDGFNQFIAPFFWETLDGSWNGATGLGHDIFSIMAVKDRVKCAAVDLMFLRTGINLQAMDAASQSRVNLIRFGPVNVIPSGFTVQQSTILGDMQAPVLIERLLDDVLTNNTGIYRQRQEKAEGNPRTATEVDLTFQNQAILSASAVNRFYGQLDKLYTEVYRRVTLKNTSDKDAKEFRKRCNARGVPDAAIDKVDWVRASRNAGNGSMFLRKKAIAETLQLLPLLPETGKQNFLDYALAAINGYTMVELFNPPEAKMDLPTDQENIALLENAALLQHSPITWTPTQNNIIHATTHLEAAVNAANSVTQGGSIEEVVSFLDAVGPHIGEHLKALANDPVRKQEVAQLNEQFKQLAKITDDLKERMGEMQEQQAESAQAQQQAQAIEQGVDPQTRIKQATAQADIALKAQKNQAGIQQKWMKLRQDMTLKDLRSAADIRLKRRASRAKETESD
jgi:hypothetical protein